jgi:hypothetical protein
MKSYNESTNQVQFKSGLELSAIKYCDFNKHIVKFSLEPFHVKYLKPTTGRYHRYFIDLFLEFSTGQKFIVEIKSKGETVPPVKPRKKTDRSIINYQKALQTYAINCAKWKAAKAWAEERNMKFIFLTEDQLS